MSSSPFTVNAAKVVAKDVNFWTKAFKYAIDLYKSTKVNSAEELAAKAVACAHLSGLGLAMHMHFGDAVHHILDGDSCEPGDPDLDACVQTAASIVKLAERHGAVLAEQAERSVS